MKKRYSQHGAYAGSIPGAVQVSKNVYVYCGFTIRKSPRNTFNNRHTYLITKYEGDSDNYYGRDFALSEACGTVRRILSNGRLIPLR